MSILDYRDQLRAEINKREMGEMMERINYLKDKVKGDTSIFPEPIDYDNATAQLSILEEVYTLEKELGMHNNTFRDINGLQLEALDMIGVNNAT